MENFIDEYSAHHIEKSIRWILENIFGMDADKKVNYINMVIDLLDVGKKYYLQKRENLPERERGNINKAYAHQELTAEIQELIKQKYIELEAAERIISPDPGPVPR